MEKFQERYRIPSDRLRDWDYAYCGMYFVTMCTKNREHYFGQIVNQEKDTEHSEMHLSKIGKIVDFRMGTNTGSQTGYEFRIR